MDFLERMWNGARNIWASFTMFWDRFTTREKVWVGGTIGFTIWSSLFGGTLVMGAMIAGLISVAGFMWIATYSEAFAEWSLKNRKLIDIGFSFPALFAPLFLGPTLGLLVVFFNLYVTSSLVFFGHWWVDHKKEEELKVIDVEVVA